MKNYHFKSSKLSLRLISPRFFITLALMLISSSIFASPMMTTLGGGNPNVTPKYLGYKDGPTLTSALFHTPYGIALDETYDFLYVADRDNNAIRQIDLTLGYTYTFAPTNLTVKPVGVAVDADGNVYVVNRGSTNTFSTNGTVLEFDTYGDLLATNATKLTNAASIALDSIGNIYVTVKSNTLVQISPNGTQTVIATITNAGTSLQGIVVKHNGLIAACDSGRNGIYLIDPNTGIVSTNSGFNGRGDGTGNSNHGVLKANAQFNQPTSITEAGDGSLIITDTGNNRIKVINSTIVTNLAGVASNYWTGSFPGWADGTVKVPDIIIPNVQCRIPVGIAFGSDGTVYTTEDFYDTIRKITGAGLPQPPPPPPQVPTPQIGYVDFPASATPAYSSVFHEISSFIFNNDAPIIIEGTAGSQTYYTYLNTPNIGSVPDPTSSSASAKPGYEDGLDSTHVNALAVAGIAPYVAIKAIGEKNDGSPNSAVAEATFQFITANPDINGNNAAQFTVTDVTAGSTLYYTTDGSDPTTNPGVLSVAFNASTNLMINTANFNFQSNNFLFKAFARKANYQDSMVVSNYFSGTNFVPNNISFGFASGEASSAFIASPGQTFYAPVTLSILPATVMYSLQFNLSVTNGGTNPGPAVIPGAYGFTSFLEEPIPNTTPTLYTNIPPAMFSGTGFTGLLTTNASLNLLSVGWLERAGMTNLYDTTKQTLISFSQAHDVLYLSGGGAVEVGGYQFTVPANAVSGNTYQIQIGRPSATSDGIGTPGSAVYISTPTNGSLTAGAINSIKTVTVGQIKYLAGDVYPFSWFNAGDFGKGYLNNADVEQVFQSAIYSLNYPPTGSDFFDAMDSCGNTYVNNGNGYLQQNTFANTNGLFDGNDTTINQIAFGDGQLDVCDVYVTFRRSLDPSLAWFQRFWTNGVRVAAIVPNVVPKALVKSAAIVHPKVSGSPLETNLPQVNFSASNFVASAGKTMQVPITAQIFGAYPLRVLMLNLTIVPLDGSPALTTAVSFTPNSALGIPTLTDSDGNGNYAATWLDSTITGLTGNVTIGTLTVTLPANAANNSAYAIHFDHASASPNGIASFAKKTLTGLVTLSSRTNSSYGDGIPDSWRLLWFGTVNNVLSVSNACPTGDGISNWQKFIAGVDPTVANDFPSLNAKTPVSSGATSAIHWPTVNGKKYAIERSNSLFSGTWTSITTNTGTGADMEFDDNSGGNVRFYRVRIVP